MMKKNLFIFLICILCAPAFGQHYKGGFQNGKKNGRGTYTWPNGDRYEGEWRNDSITGRGTFTWHNGDVYEGEWLNDMKHGYGKLTWADGDVYEGLWDKDEFKGRPKEDVNEVVVAQTQVGALVEEVDANYSIKGQKGRAKTNAVTTYKIRNIGNGYTSYLLPAKQLIINRPGFQYLTWQEVIKTPFRESDILRIGLGAIGHKSEIQSMCNRYGKRTGKIQITLSNNMKLEGEARMRDARTEQQRKTRNMAQYVADVKLMHLTRVGVKHQRIDKYHEYDIIRMLSRNDIVSVKINGMEFDLSKAGYATLINEVYNN